MSRANASRRVAQLHLTNIEHNIATISVMAALQIDKITVETFKATLARYSDAAPSALAELDLLRYETAPAKLGNMKGEKHLLKSDVERLVEWKL